MPPTQLTLAGTPTTTGAPELGVSSRNGVKVQGDTLQASSTGGLGSLHLESATVTPVEERQITLRVRVPSPPHSREQRPHSPADHENVSHGCGLQAMKPLGLGPAHMDSKQVTSRVEYFQ